MNYAGRMSLPVFKFDHAAQRARRHATLLKRAAAPFAVICALSANAHADDTIKHPGDHPHYAVEIEPHVLFGWADFYGSTGFGLGGRVSIPIVDNGFIKTINNSVAVSFGLDFVHYSGCYVGNLNNSCGANFLLLPAVMQWNFFVAQHWSVFGEPGLAIYHGFIDTSYCDAFPTGTYCPRATSTGLLPAFYLGGRYHFTENVALTMRVGYPTFSVGVSFM